MHPQRLETDGWPHSVISDVHPALCPSVTARLVWGEVRDKHVTRLLFYQNAGLSQTWIISFNKQIWEAQVKNYALYLRSSARTPTSLYSERWTSKQSSEYFPGEGGKIGQLHNFRQQTCYHNRNQFSVTQSICADEAVMQTVNEI